MEKKDEKITPMMQQYLSIKERYKDAFLFFRVGDFYELFYDDAIKASSILNIALTSRNKGDKDAVPLCGVPYHAVDYYLNKLIQEGYKAVLCDQVEDPKLSKGIVKREVVKVITPGTVIDLDALDPKKNNFIVSLYFKDNDIDVAFADASCGDIKYFSTDDLKKDLFERFHVNELVVLDKDRDKVFDTIKDSNFPVSIVSEKEFVTFEKDYTYNKALAVLEFYIKHIALINSLDFSKAQPFSLKNYMFVDENSQRDLEIFEPLLISKKNFTLLSVMDNTITSMGSRLLRNYLTFPLLDLVELNERLNIVEIFVHNSFHLDAIRNVLKRFADLERILTNLESYSPSPRYLLMLLNSLKEVPKLKSLINEIPGILEKFYLEEFHEVVKLIENSILEECNTNIREGGIIKDGYSEELDELRKIMDGGSKFIVDYEKKEREKTGISSLKVRFNKVFGYYIEVTKANLSNVPDYYHRKQTLVNAERFITDELKALEEKVLTASEKSRQLEYMLFMDIVKEVLKYKENIKKLSNEIAHLDVLTNFAYNAIRHNYVKPKVKKGGSYKIIEGRHPFVEQSIINFVPNDTVMDKQSNIMLITGPNMAGKSTYMRQVALITIMAQTGSFVPAKSSELPLIEQIFTRIGTSDFLAAGKSTFMVEMLETSRILKESTENSLVILDEVGRGTSTYDGMAIAWAVLEFLANFSKRPYVLFSTHYHELTELSLTFKNIRNYNVSVREWKNEIVFLHKLQEGVANRSYGIHVAKLAGLPDAVIKRAMDILENLEDGLLKEKKIVKNTEDKQLTLFKPIEYIVCDELRELNINKLTPLDCFDILRKFKNMVGDK